MIARSETSVSNVTGTPCVLNALGPDTNVSGIFVLLLVCSARPILWLGFYQRMGSVAREHDLPELDFRESRRYELRSSVIFCWKESDGSLQTGKGNTQNISTQGICVTSATPPPVGKQIWFELLLPSLRNAFGVQLDGCGVVVRIDDCPVRSFAVRADLHSNSPGFIDRESNIKQ